MNYLIRILKRYLKWRNDDFEDEDFDITDLFFFKDQFIIECEYYDYVDDSTASMSDDGSDYRDYQDNNSIQIKDIDYTEMLDFLNNPETFEKTK